VTRRAAVFLDRDGVLNEAHVQGGVPMPPGSLEAFRILPGAAEACTAFSAAGLVLVVVTNQPDLSRGALTPADLEAMHERLRESLPLDDIVVCPHDDHDGCPCRKPRPGMILDAARRLDLDLNRSVCVGDRWRDVEAGRRAGVHTVHIDWGHGERLRSTPDAAFGSLLDAKDHVLKATALPLQEAVHEHKEETT
jgi:D-glycero-D-manno-heptose 1,7-bisphosphate phosphatase